MINAHMVILPVGILVKVFQKAQESCVHTSPKKSTLHLVILFSHTFQYVFPQTQDCLNLYKLISAGSAIVIFHVNGQEGIQVSHYNYTSWNYGASVCTTPEKLGLLPYTYCCTHNTTESSLPNAAQQKCVRYFG